MGSESFFYLLMIRYPFTGLVLQGKNIIFFSSMNYRYMKYLCVFVYARHPFLLVPLLPEHFISPFQTSNFVADCFLLLSYVSQMSCNLQVKNFWFLIFYLSHNVTKSLLSPLLQLLTYILQFSCCISWGTIPTVLKIVSKSGWSV